MSVLVKYKIDSDVKDIVMYCSIESTINEIEQRISDIIDKKVKVIYIKF